MSDEKETTAEVEAVEVEITEEMEAELAAMGKGDDAEDGE